MDIKGSVFLITGASSGIGAATARLAAGHGARVVLVARRTERIEVLAADLPDALAVTADITDADQQRAAVEAATQRYGRLDVLVNNAGQGLQLPLEEVALNDFRAVIELNLVAPLAAMQAVIPIMRRQGGGAIVNVSSGTSRIVIPGVGAYSATKSALNMVSQVARAELAVDGINVSVVYPNVATTEFFDVLRAGTPRPGGPGGHTAESVAELILDVVGNGSAEAFAAYPYPVDSAARDSRPQPDLAVHQRNRLAENHPGLTETDGWRTTRGAPPVAPGRLGWQPGPDSRPGSISGCRLMPSQVRAQEWYGPQ
jgi:NADP-dependent 3-hydroxy acid dehydrogenase YdfG